MKTASPPRERTCDATRAASHRLRVPAWFTRVLRRPCSQAGLDVPPPLSVSLCLETAFNEAMRFNKVGRWRPPHRTCVLI